jgi:hypothetical protein
MIRICVAQDNTSSWKIAVKGVPSDLITPRNIPVEFIGKETKEIYEGQIPEK